MHKIPINDFEAQHLGLFRVALSEPDARQRLEAIRTVKLEVQSANIGLYMERRSPDRPLGPRDLDELISIAETEKARLEAARESVRLHQRYEGKNGLGHERKLNIAEHIGDFVLLSIRDENFTGLHGYGGILEQVRQQASDLGIRGGVDKDTIRKIWNAYRGVVHLGIALNYDEQYPDEGYDVLRLAESIRLNLAEHHPRGAPDPYVYVSEQISFVSNQ